ncbi:MAG: TolC family protein, partial [Planctomycetota bacterium]
MRSPARLLSIGVLASCTVVGEDYVRPELLLEQSWAAAVEQGYVSEPPSNLGTWWEVYEDPRLDALVASALSGNLDLAAAVVRVEQAAAIRGQAVGNRFPDFDGTGGYTRNRFGENGFPALGDAQTYDAYSLGLDVAW